MSAKKLGSRMPETDDSQRLEKRTISEEVAAILRNRILEGYYPPGEFMRQDDIALQLGVSRVPVREALQHLEADGLVTLVKYRGALVPSLSLSELTEICELRQIIESHLIRHAVENISPAQIAKIEGILSQARSIKTPTPEWVELNIAFHMRIFEAANKPLALQSLQNLLLRTNRYLKAQPKRSPPDKNSSDAEHRNLLELIKAKDVDGAIALLQAHISSHSERMREGLIPGGK